MANLMLPIAFLCTSLVFAPAKRINIKSDLHTGSRVMRTDDALLNKAGSPLLRPAADVTVGGCTCKSPCESAKLWDLGKCDYCYTTGNCSVGRWDYCKYPAQTEYEAQTSEEKTAQLWGAMIADDVISKSQDLTGKLGVFNLMLTESMRTPFDNWKDVLPIGRKKVIHAQGVHCKIKFDVSKDSTYTGIFSPGTQTGFIRMGSAAAISNSTGKIVPGLGFKFTRSGVQSGNFVGLASDPDGRNFFSTDFSNHVAPPDITILRKKFAQGSGCINMVGLSDLAEWNQAGEHIEEPSFPYELIMKPKAHVSDTTGDHQKNPDALLLEQLSLKEGTPLFDVFAHATPKNKNDGVEPSFVGSMSTASDCVKSLFGDQQFFIRHQRMEEDFKRHPEWLDDIDLSKDCFSQKSTDASNWKCAGN